MLELIITDLEKEIERVSGCNKPQPERRYHKHNEYICYGLKTPLFHKMMKDFKPRFIELSLCEQLELAAKLLDTHIGELGHAGIYVFSLISEQLQPKHFPILDAAVDNFKSWSHVDVFCTQVTPDILFNYPKQTLKLLEKWNRSSNRFKRRASVVTFIQDVAKSGKFLDDALRLCENLVFDEEDIVRKGVGWTLKINMRYSQKRVLDYVKELRKRGVPSTITLYAIENLPPEIRKEVLTIKKQKS